MENSISPDEEPLISTNKQLEDKKYLQDSYESRKNKALSKINNIIDEKIELFYGYDDEITPINITTTVDNYKLLFIVLNQQKRIVIHGKSRVNILKNLKVENIAKWHDFFKREKEYIQEQQEYYNVSFGNSYVIRKSLVFPRSLRLSIIVPFLDAHFGDDFFPRFTFEDAAAIIFIKAIISYSFIEYKSEYRKLLSHYIKYMAFALKIVIDKIQNVEVDQCSNPYKIKTFSAYQNILLNLNKEYL